MMAKYTYDAWGKVLSVTDGSGVIQSSSSFIGNINPIRYRGYYYDTETGLYYLQSRYYDPETGRFVNADAFAQTGTGVFDKNMYAYCLNDPVNYSDSTGACAHTSFPGRCDICGEFNSSYMQDKPTIEANTSSIVGAGANPQKDPPDHPSYKPPKKGDKKVQNPNGKVVDGRQKMAGFGFGHLKCMAIRVGQYNIREEGIAMHIPAAE